MNNIFSPKRFGLYIRQYIGENWKKLLQMTATIFGLLIVLTTVIPFINDSYTFPRTQYDAMWNQETSMFWSILFVLVAVVAGTMFSNMATKAKRISLLTLPASNLEKFLTLIIFYVIGIYVVFFIAMIVADYARVLIAPLYASPEAVIAPLPLKYFFNFGKVDGSLQILEYIRETIKCFHLAVFSSLIIIQSFYALAAVIWPKSGKLRGTLAGVCIMIGLITILSFSVEIFFSSGHIIPRPAPDGWDFDTFITVSYVVAIAVTTGTYLLAYRRFKESESIERW